MDKRILIEQDSRRNIMHCALVSAAGLLCLLLLFLSFSGPPDKAPHINSFHTIQYTFTRAVLLLGFTLFSGGSISHIRRIIARKDLLIVDENGIIDHSSGISLGFIPWEDVEGVFLSGALDNPFIEVAVKNESKYLAGLKGMKKLIIQANKRSGRQIVCIILKFTEESPERILLRMQALLEGYKTGLSDRLYESSAAAPNR